MLDELLEFDLQLFAEGEQDGDPAPDTGDEPTGGDTSPEKDEKMLPQSAVSAIVAREVRKAVERREQELEEARQREKMTEAERLKAEKEEAERKAAERVQAANQRILNAEAKVLAAQLGVKPERVDYVLRLADLSGVAFDDDGNPDGEAIKSAVEKVVADLPELKGAPAKVGGSSNPPGGGNTGEKNPWSKDHFNLTEQGRILRENPALAARLKAEAGK